MVQYGTLLQEFAAVNDQIAIMILLDIAPDVLRPTKPLRIDCFDAENNRPISRIGDP